MLSQARFDLKRPNLQLAWRVWNSFAQELFDATEDGVLFECGISDLTGKELFTWGFGRHFFIYVDGELNEQQLDFKFSCAPTDELRKLHASAWSYEFASLHEYFDHVEELKAFRNPLLASQKWTWEIEQRKL
jgi:hypothetical protein